MLQPGAPDRPRPPGLRDRLLRTLRQGEDGGRSSIELLYGQASVADLAFETGTENLSVIPSTIELVDQNELLLREQRLKFALDDADDTYDIAIIDCSPVLKRLPSTRTSRLRTAASSSSR